MTAIEDFEKRMGIQRVELKTSTQLPTEIKDFCKSLREHHDSLPISLPADISKAILNKTFINNQGGFVSLTPEQLRKLTNLLEATKQMYYDKKDRRLTELAYENFREFNKPTCNIDSLTKKLCEMRTIIADKMIGGCIDGA